MKQLEIKTIESIIVYLSYIVDIDYPITVQLQSKNNANTTLKTSDYFEQKENISLVDNKSFYFDRYWNALIFHNSLLSAEIKVEYYTDGTFSQYALSQYSLDFSRILNFLNHRIISGLFLWKPKEIPTTHVPPVEENDPLQCFICPYRRYSIVLSQGDLMYHGKYYCFTERVYNTEFLNFPTQQNLYRGYIVYFDGNDIQIKYTSQLYEKINLADIELNNLIKELDIIEIGRFYILVKGNTPEFIIKNTETYRKIS